MSRISFAPARPYLHATLALLPWVGVYVGIIALMFDTRFDRWWFLCVSAGFLVSLALSWIFLRFEKQEESMFHPMTVSLGAVVSSAIGIGLFILLNSLHHGLLWLWIVISTLFAIFLARQFIRIKIRHSVRLQCVMMALVFFLLLPFATLLEKPCFSDECRISRATGKHARIAHTITDYAEYEKTVLALPLITQQIGKVTHIYATDAYWRGFLDATLTLEFEVYGETGRGRLVLNTWRGDKGPIYICTENTPCWWQKPGEKKTDVGPQLPNDLGG